MKVNQSRFLAKYVILVVTGILGEHLNIYIYIKYVYTLKLTNKSLLIYWCPHAWTRFCPFFFPPQDSEWLVDIDFNIPKISLPKKTPELQGLKKTNQKRREPWCFWSFMHPTKLGNKNSGGLCQKRLFCFFHRSKAPRYPSFRPCSAWPDKGKWDREIRGFP